MPEKFKGKDGKPCGYTLSKPRQWTKEEIDWVLNLKSKGYKLKEIAYSIGRTETSISIKLKRLSKNKNTYNKKHVSEKYLLNEMFVDEIKPKTILDLYCGKKSFYKGKNVTTNDINKDFNADYHEDAFKLICKLYYENQKYDLIDLDPYGSAYDCFDIAIKMAKKGLIITLGELGHQRWKRLDFVESHYNIKDLEEFNIKNLIKYIQTIALRNKKRLVVWQYREWQNIGRVYFKVENEKITSQWDKAKLNFIDNEDMKNKQLSIFDIYGGNDEI